MTHDQAAADRERIAGEMQFDSSHPWKADDFKTLDNAVRAFEVLCEPRGRGWRLRWNKGRAWTLTHPKMAYGGMAHPELEKNDTGSHAADVCRLVCEVLDREANPPENQCPECRTLMVRSGRVWKCLNCGTEKEPKHGT